MLGGKTNSGTRPTALGTLLNASTYGATIPTIIGMTRSTLLAIWAANLRDGHSSKKAKKKGTPTFVENVDFLVGSNPIQGILQMWSNNSSRYVLDLGQTGWINTGGSASFSFVDAQFYWVIAVVAQISLYGFFQDYGSPVPVGAIGQLNIGTGPGQAGTGYAPGDFFSVDHQVGTSGLAAIGRVLTVGGGGAVATFTLEGVGSGYHTGFNQTTTTLTGGGSGLIVSIFGIGVPYGTQSFPDGQTITPTEYPLWNVWDHGPDLANGGAMKYYPYVYGWKPGDGPLITLPSNMSVGGGIPHNNGLMKVYYYKLSPTHSDGLTPLAFNRMFFESELGNGTEYSPAPGQQIIYPFYAGVGSPDIDLGATGLLPEWRVEVAGSYKRFQRGDADFTSMIEDTIKSGAIQTGAQLGIIQRGVNCGDLPALIQKNIYVSLEPATPVLRTYYQPNAVGSILIAATKWRQAGGTPPSILDDAGNSWNTELATPGWTALWTASSVGAPAGNTVHFAYHGGGIAYDNNSYIFETDPSTNTIEDRFAVSNGTFTGPITGSLTVAGPSLLFVWVELGTGGDQVSYPNVPHWTPAVNYYGAAQPYIATRKVISPGTYTFSLDVGPVSNVSLVMLALSQSQPTMLPKALGNILDETTLNLTKDQCQANGLIGSITMNSQRAASDWLDEFGKCANAAYVWSGDKLKVIPWSEVSIADKGVVYNAPTASGPVATIALADLIGSSSESVITMERKAQVDRNNILQCEHVNRDNDYNFSTVSEPESGAIALYGPRKESPQSLHEIQDPAVARMILSIQKRRLVYLNNVYKFKLTAKWIWLEAMDLILLPIHLILGGEANYIPVRLTSIEENDKFELDCAAEDFLYGVNAPNQLTTTVQTGFQSDSQIVPGPVNPPIIFEPPLRMTLSGQPEIWIIDSNSDPHAGGSLVFVSVDGGFTYTAQPIATIIGNAPTGYVETQDFPAHADPDATNTLDVDLSESNGVLENYTAAEENNFIFPIFLGATPTPTPTIIGNSGSGFGPSPAECLTFAPPAPLGGIQPGDCMVFFAKQRDVIGGQTSFFFSDAFSPALSGGGLVPTGGFIRFRQGAGACGGIDPYIIAVYDEHTFSCPCLGRSLPTLIMYTSEGGGNGFNYDFAYYNVYVRGANFAPRFIFGTLGSVVTLDEYSFDSSLVSGGTTGGTGVLLVKLWPAVPGNPGLFLALVAGATGTTPPPGWTFVGGGNGCLVFSRVGTAVQSPNTYELATYQTATLLSPSHYEIDGTVEPIRRSVFGVPTPGMGIDHDIGSRFGFIGDWQTKTIPPGTAKIKLDPAWLGKDLFFKLVQFNTLGGGVADLATVTPYDYTPTGVLPGGGSTGGGTGQPGQPGQVTYTISGGQLSNPTATTIDMAKAIVNFSNGSSVYYNARVFTIPAPTQPTTYFITIFDPNLLGDTGTSTTLASQASLDSGFVGVPGYIYIGSITVLPGGGGTFTTPGGYPPGEQILVNGI